MKIGKKDIQNLLVNMVVNKKLLKKKQKSERKHFWLRMG